MKTILMISLVIVAGGSQAFAQLGGPLTPSEASTCKNISFGLADSGVQSRAAWDEYTKATAWLSQLQHTPNLYNKEVEIGNAQKKLDQANKDVSNASARIVRITNQAANLGPAIVSAHHLDLAVYGFNWDSCQIVKIQKLQVRSKAKK